MSEPQDPRDLLDRAERAAAAGDLESAAELLRQAARIQEDRLGPQHPDLAKTLNNLAIVAERTGRPDEAETCYHRAVAIASASLPDDHPMVVDSRQNLEDFCRARGLPVDRPVVTAPTPQAAPATAKPPAQPSPPPTSGHASPPAAIRGASEEPAAPSPAAPRRAPAPIAAAPLPPVRAGETRSRPMLWTAAAVFAVLAVVLLLWRPWSSRDETSQPPTEAASPAAVPPPAAPAIGPAEPSEAAPRTTSPAVTAKKPPPPTAPAAGATVDAQVCQNFSARGSRWRCTPIGNPVSPGRLVLYTRVTSPRSTAVIHRWYRGNTLRQSVRLGVRANAVEGYRTYSRQTVTPGEWRVEVGTTDGGVLHEQRFTVK